jgi:hypothetical protein
MNRTHIPHEFCVEGGGEFPFDMLRYDSAYPKTQSDVVAMLTKGRRAVTLVSHSPNAPTVERWSSYLWRLKGEA